MSGDYCNKKKTCPYSSFRSKICKNGLQKWNLLEKLGKEHLDYQKSTLAKSQRSNLVKVNCQREKSMDDVSKLIGNDVSRWRQLGLTWQLRRQQVTQRRMKRMDQLHQSLGRRVRARGLFDDTDSFPKMQIGERWFWWSRQQQDWSYPGGVWSAWHYLPKLWPVRGGTWMVRYGCFWRLCVERLKIYTVIYLMS